MADQQQGAGSSYWQTTQIKFNDGMQISVVLDAPTLQRLQEGDAALMDKIRKNAQESALTIPTAGTSSDCPVSHSSTSTDATSGESSSSQPKFWTKNDTMFLITTRMSMEDDFNSMKTHKSLWQKIAEEISAKGEVCTAKQCENKFKSLKRDYKATVDHNNTSGNTPKTCPFYEEFNSMYGMKASSRPECTLSSIAGVENPQQPKMKKRKRQNQTDDPSPDWLKQYEERTISNLPQEMLQLIMSYLSHKDLYNLGLVNKKFRTEVLGVLQAFSISTSDIDSNSCLSQMSSLKSLIIKGSNNVQNKDALKFIKIVVGKGGLLKLKTLELCDIQIPFNLLLKIIAHMPNLDTLLYFKRILL